MINDIIFILAYNPLTKFAQIAQLVEQRTENPCVGGSIPPLGTSLTTFLKYSFYEHL